MNFFASGLDYFVKGGPVMYPLLLCSIAAIAISVERYLFFRKADSGRDFTRKFCEYVEQDNWIVNVRAERALDKFDNRLNYLNVIVTLAPVLGLLGTVTGMIGSFNNFSQRLDNPLAVTAGIGEALITTVFGLCISIIAICMYAYFNRRLTTITLNVEDVANTLLEAIAKNLDKQAETKE